MQEQEPKLDHNSNYQIPPQKLYHFRYTNLSAGEVYFQISVRKLSKVHQILNELIELWAAVSGTKNI